MTMETCVCLLARRRGEDASPRRWGSARSALYGRWVHRGAFAVRRRAGSPQYSPSATLALSVRRPSSAGAPDRVKGQPGDGMATTGIAAARRQQWSSATHQESNLASLAAGGQPGSPSASISGQLGSSKSAAGLHTPRHHHGNACTRQADAHFTSCSLAAIQLAPPSSSLDSSPPAAHLLITHRRWRTRPKHIRPRTRSSTAAPTPAAAASSAASTR
ncbi:hypothetical protein ON010_g10765 [Phytophthora cinnamomi]|nr:hypothetical protein ON010_g10765 [Phytophthora cinnamomi]